MMRCETNLDQFQRSPQGKRPSGAFFANGMVTPTVMQRTTLPPRRTLGEPPEARWIRLTTKSETVPKLPIKIKLRGGAYVGVRPRILSLSV